MNDYVLGGAFVLAFGYWAIIKIRSWFKQPLTTSPKPPEPAKPKPTSRYETFKGQEWKFRVDSTDEDGHDHPPQGVVKNILLQEIRDQQADLLKATKANTKATKELKAYLMQVFGGENESKA